MHDALQQDTTHGKQIICSASWVTQIYFTVSFIYLQYEYTTAGSV
jgi:hypothetical protein